MRTRDEISIFDAATRQLRKMKKKKKQVKKQILFAT